MIAEYQTRRDDYFRGTYLPMPAALGDLQAAAGAAKLERSGPLAVFKRVPPSAVAVVRSQARLARRVGALRVIESLRSHVQAGEGLPATLDAVKNVLIPLDPGTGRAFDYRRDGDAAVLAVPPLLGASRPNISDRITLRRGTGAGPRG